MDTTNTVVTISTRVQGSQTMTFRTCFQKRPWCSTAWFTQRHFTKLGCDVFIAKINTTDWVMQNWSQPVWSV